MSANLLFHLLASTKLNFTVSEVVLDDGSSIDDDVFDYLPSMTVLVCLKPGEVYRQPAAALTSTAVVSNVAAIQPDLTCVLPTSTPLTSAIEADSGDIVSYVMSGDINISRYTMEHQRNTSVSHELPTNVDSNQVRTAEDSKLRTSGMYKISYFSICNCYRVVTFLENAIYLFYFQGPGKPPRCGKTLKTIHSDA
jgi:hypothetical protein